MKKSCSPTGSGFFNVIWDVLFDLVNQIFKRHSGATRFCLSEFWLIFLSSSRFDIYFLQFRADLLAGIPGAST